MDYYQVRQPTSLVGEYYCIDVNYFPHETNDNRVYRNIGTYYLRDGEYIHILNFNKRIKKSFIENIRSF